MSLVPVKRRDNESSDLARAHRQVDDLFSGFFQDWDRPMRSSRNWPVMDIVEKDNTFMVIAELPGVKSADVDISVTGSILTITGEKQAPLQPQKKGYVHSERVFGQFRRDVNMGVEINTNKIEAVCENGVLTITLPKSEKAMPMKVKVKEA